MHVQIQLLQGIDANYSKHDECNVKDNANES